MFFTSPFPVLPHVFCSVYTGVWTFLNEHVEIRTLISWAAFVKTTIKTARCHHSKSTVSGGFCLLREPQLCKLYPTLCSTPHYLSIMMYNDRDVCFFFLCPGNLIPRHQELFYKNPAFAGVRLPEIKEMEPLERRYPKLSEVVIDLTKVIIRTSFAFWKGICNTETGLSLLFFLV